MSEIFFYTNGVDSNGTQIQILNKAIYHDSSGALSGYTNLQDSSDVGIINLNQPFSPFHVDSDTGETDSDGAGNVFYVKDIVQFNRPWDSSGEAFSWIRSR